MPEQLPPCPFSDEVNMHPNNADTANIRPLVSVRPSHLTAPANKGISFGMPKQEVASALKDSLYASPEEGVFSYEMLYGVKVKMGCCFVRDSLNCLLYKCSYEHPYLDEFVSLYNYFVDEITKQYGKPEHHATEWMKTDYVGVPGKMGEAYLQKHAITMHCWLLQNKLYVASYIAKANDRLHIWVVVGDEFVQSGFRDSLFEDFAEVSPEKSIIAPSLVLTDLTNSG